MQQSHERDLRASLARLSLTSGVGTGAGAFLCGGTAWALASATGLAWLALLWLALSCAALGAWSHWQSVRSQTRSRAVSNVVEGLGEHGRLAGLDVDALREMGDSGAAAAALYAELEDVSSRVIGTIERVEALPERLDGAIGQIAESAGAQEEAVEEAASLMANIKSSMKNITDRVSQLERSAEESASSILEMGSSVDEVARNAASLHESVEASTSSVHEMGASIRQVAAGAGEVERIAEETAGSMLEMDRVVQEITANAREAAQLTAKVSQGAERGGDAVGETIEDIKAIHGRTEDAREGLATLVNRIDEIAGILGVIREINDETNLLSLNAAIIAAQAGEQGKAFLVVANHVKTLARRTAASTQDIERLIFDVQKESVAAVEAMNAGVDVIETGVARSSIAGDALQMIRDSAREASERVEGIARSTDEQARASKLVANAAQETSSQVRQISQAMGEQSKVSEQMLQSSEAALEMCRHVHRSTDEQRDTGRYITDAIANITEMIRVIREHTGNHSTASDAVRDSVMRLLENAQRSAERVPEIGEMLAELRDGAQDIIGELSRFGDEEPGAGDAPEPGSPAEA